MRDKAGCLNCHFLCKFIPMLSYTERTPILDEFRNKAGFLKLIEESQYAFECFRENWKIINPVAEDAAKIEKKIFGKDRGRKCLKFSAYDKDATLEAVLETSIIEREVMKHKTTRRIALAAVIISGIATLIAFFLPLHLSGRLRLPFIP